MRGSPGLAEMVKHIRGKLADLGKKWSRSRIAPLPPSREGSCLHLSHHPVANETVHGWTAVITERPGEGSDRKYRCRVALRCAVAVLSVVTFVCIGQSSHSATRSGAAAMLSQAKGEQDPHKKITILDAALKSPGLRGEILSALLFERGMAHKKLKHWFRAIEDFSAALAHSRKALPARLENAECLIEVDQLEEASREVEYYLLSKPADARAYVIKGRIYEREGFLNRAQDEYTRALYYDPQSKIAFSARANAYLRAGKLHEALSDANSLAEMDTRDPAIFTTRAEIYLKLKNYKAALQDYDKAEALEPGNDQILEKKIRVYFEKGQPEKALEVLTSKGVADRQDLNITVLRARAHIALGDYSEAEKILKPLLSKFPDSAPVHLYTGMVLVRRKKYDEALAYLNRALELDASLVEAYKERARAFSELGDPVRAAVDLTKALDLDPADGEIWAMRGLTFVKRRLYDAGIKDFSRALENLPENPGILYERAAAYLYAEQPESALADLDKALQVRPGAARAISLRGVANFRLGKLEAARDDLRRAPNVEPRDAVLWNNLGFYYYKTGDQKRAMDAINKALQLDPQYGKARYNLKLVLDKDTGKAAAASGATPDSISSGK